MHNSARSVRERPPRTEQVQRLGEYVVVNETRVDGKQAHEENNVPPATNPPVSQALTGKEKKTRLEEHSHDLA